MKQAWIERTEQYFDNEMSAAERSLFEQEMAANEELSSYVSLYREIEAVMRNDEKNDSAEQALRTSLGKLNTFYFDKKVKGDAHNPIAANENLPFEREPAIPGRRSKRKISSWMRLTIAAAVIGIIAIAITWFSKNREPQPIIARSEKTDAGQTTTDSLQTNDSVSLAFQNNADSPAAINHSPARTSKKQEELFAANFKPDAVPAVTAGPLEDAFTYYAEKHYSDAAQEFSSADLTSGTRGLETDSTITAFYADYYAGISYLEQSDNSKSILKLESALTKSPAELYTIKASWYLALAYVKAGEIKKANGQLAKISENKNETFYRSKATRLLTALK